MEKGAFVVVFPSMFAKNKQSLLIQNVKKILKVQNQSFRQITKDDDLILIDANDPVFASSAANMLFGIAKVCIARQVEASFDSVVSEIAKIGTNLLLKGEEFYVRVEGHTSGYIPKDVEIAATSALIESTQKSGCKPGTEERHDKQIYCFLTRKNAYVSIFLDEGHGGVPYNSQGQRMLCCVHDELSAVSCLEAIKQGFDVRVIVCYDDTNMHDLVKMVNRLIPRMLSGKVLLEFFKIPNSKETPASILQRYLIAASIMCNCAKRDGIQRVGLALSPLTHSTEFIDYNTGLVQKSRLQPWILLAGIDDGIIRTAKEIGLGKYLGRIEKFGSQSFPKRQAGFAAALKKVPREGKRITLKVGPNNVHEMLDFLNH